MYSFLLTSRVLPESDYEFFTFTGKEAEVNFRNEPKSIHKGQIFGVRPSTSGKAIRLILNKDMTRVFTPTLDQAKYLAKYSKPL